MWDGGRGGSGRSGNHVYVSELPTHESWWWLSPLCRKHPPPRGLPGPGKPQRAEPFGSHLILSHPPLLGGLLSHRRGHSGMATLCSPGSTNLSEGPPGPPAPGHTTRPFFLSRLSSSPEGPGSPQSLSLLLPCLKPREPSLSGEGDKTLAAPCLRLKRLAPNLLQAWGCGASENPHSYLAGVCALRPDTPTRRAV